jgi:MFS-type transporter involved in bile tolerance (Atg22 family)
MPAAIPRSLRSVLAVLAGLLATFALTIACTLLAVHTMHLKSAHPTPGYLALNVFYSLLAAVMGGWVAARLSGYKPLHHALALAMILAALGLTMLIRPAPSQPYNYQLMMAVLPSFAVLGGGWLAARSLLTQPR